VIADEHKTPVAPVAVPEGVPATAPPGGLDCGAGPILLPCLNELFDLEEKLW